MRTISIQGRLGLLFLAFALLVTVSVLATFWGIDAQKKDALVINLAGRQRMLAQQMGRLSLEIEMEGDGDLARDLQQAQLTFAQTLDALQNGGPAPYSPGETVWLPRPRNHEIQFQLEQVRATWEELQSALALQQKTPDGTPQSQATLQQIGQLSQELVGQADEAVQYFQADAARKVAWLRAVQVAFFISALSLLVAGGWVTRQSIVEPLNELGQAARRIGEGNLDGPLQEDGPQEVRLVVQAFKAMRSQLKASQDELLNWTEALEKRVGHRTRVLDALYEVSREISSRLDVQHVLGSVTDKARQLLEADVAALCLVDEDSPVLKLNALSGPNEAVTGKRESDLGGLVGQVLTGEGALLCASQDCSGGCGMLKPDYRLSHMAAPLRAGEQVIGALCVGSPRPEVFTDEAPRLLTKLANSAAIALENARLYDRAERVATMEERQRIAAEMHDGLGQTLSYLGLSIDQAGDQIQAGHYRQALEQLERSRQGVSQAIQQAREAIASLLEETPVPRSLQAHLQALAGELDQPEHRVVLQAARAQPFYLAAEGLEQILRATREAILNAQRHGQAAHTVVRLDCDDQEAVLSVTDDGQGFDLAQPLQDGRQHFGLQIMHARLAHLGGTFAIESAPGQGTRVVLRWPIAS